MEKPISTWNFIVVIEPGTGYVPEINHLSCVHFNHTVTPWWVVSMVVPVVASFGDYSRDWEMNYGHTIGARPMIAKRINNGVNGEKNFFG